MTITGILAGIAVVGVVRLRDAGSARAGANEIAHALGLARQAAVAWRTTIAFRVDTAGGRVEVRRGENVLRLRDLGSEYGVQLGASRDSVVYDGRGLGRGVSNATFVVRRGAAAESVVVSRLGRVRR